MAPTLRVDPARLRDAADAQSAVGHFVSDMASGQSMTSAGASMAGLSSEAACNLAATVLDATATTASDELAEHSSNLTKAAERYRQTDEDCASRVRTLGP